MQVTETSAEGLHREYTVKVPADDIENIIVNSGIYNFIIGESLLKSPDIGAKLKQLTQISL